MEVITDEPELQFYGGNLLNGKDIGEENLPYGYKTAFSFYNIRIWRRILFN